MHVLRSRNESEHSGERTQIGDRQIIDKPPVRRQSELAASAARSPDVPFFVVENLERPVVSRARIAEAHERRAVQGDHPVLAALPGRDGM